MISFFGEKNDLYDIEKGEKQINDCCEIHQFRIKMFYQRNANCSLVKDFDLNSKYADMNSCGELYSTMSIKHRWAAYLQRIIKFTNVK